MSRIGPVMSGIWPRNDIDVWNEARVNWPYFGHCTLMSRTWPAYCWSHSGHHTAMCGIWPGKTGLLPDNGHVTDIVDDRIITRAHICIQSEVLSNSTLFNDINTLFKTYFSYFFARQEKQKKIFWTEFSCHVFLEFC